MAKMNQYQEAEQLKSGCFQLVMKGSRVDLAETTAVESATLTWQVKTMTE